MFKKSSKRNLRARKTSDDDGMEDASENGPKILNVGMLKAERKKKMKKNKDSKSASSKQSVLSFDQEDEEDTVFQLKKPSRSKRIAKHIKRIAQEEKERNQNEGNKYTAETLKELKALSVQPPVFENIEHAEYDASNNSAASFATNQSANFYSLKPGEIPDANRIHAARKQREMMRKYGAEYIPVENASNSVTLREQHDHDGNSSDEDDPTVEMKGIIDDSIRVAGEIGCEGESALNRDNEFDEWEAEMIKKGISTQQFVVRNEQNDAVASPVSNDFVKSAVGLFNGAMAGGNVGYQQKSWTHGSTVQSMPPNETIKNVKARLTRRLEDIEQTNSTRKMDFERVDTDIEASENSAEKMEDLTSLSNQYLFFQDIKAYVMDLLDCLSEKNAEITALEETMHKTLKVRANMLVSRRQQDVRDESEDITLSLSNSKVNPTPVDNLKLTRVREREARRTRRRAKRQISRNSQAYINGLSTDDEETSMDMIKRTSVQDRIAHSAQTVFNDVVEEFCDVNTILSRFLEWKEKFPDSYSDAFIGLCLPKLIMPYIKLQILGWNPLAQGAVTLEEMLWYKQLLFHGNKPGSVADNQDSDNKLLSGLFDKLIMPKLIFLVGEVWDPLSRVQSHCLSMMLCRYIRTYPCMRAESKKCNDLLVNICARLQQAIETDAFIPIYPTTALSNVVTGPGAFFERQTWTCIKLFQNIFLFEGILSKGTLIELAFTSLLNRYIMLSLQISPATTALVHKCSCIVDAVPSRWLHAVDELSSHLEPFSRYLLHIAKLIHSGLHQCTASEERKAKSCIGQIGKLLSKIGSYEMCQEIADLLGINI